MDQQELERLAALVDEAAQNAGAISQLSLGHNFTEDESYEIQRLSINHRLERGEKMVGLKMGFTSEAKMKQMGVHDLIWGRLTDSMQLDAGGTLQMDRFIHPRAEPEVCFLIKKEINKAISYDEAMDYVSAVALAVEIIDSRYENFKFSLEDVVADNCSSAAFVIGEWLPANTPLNHLAVAMNFDGEAVQTGSTHAILGDPIKSLVAAARLAAKYGESIQEGAIVLAGAATPANYLKRNQLIKVEIAGLGEVSFKTSS